ncbi:MAG: NAD(P) transhydrogenase subunit alpha [Pseudomonadota bacterium]
MQDNAPTKEDVEAAVAAAEDAAFKAEKAAAASAENADQAASAAKEATGSLDALLSFSESLGGPSDFVYLLAIFALAIFVGYYVVWSVTPALHTPLMSVTNAVSSVVIVGALIALGANLADSQAGGVSKALGFIAVILASINIFGGFLVTQRMLAMYKKKEQ